MVLKNKFSRANCWILSKYVDEVNIIKFRRLTGLVLTKNKRNSRKESSFCVDGSFYYFCQTSPNCASVLHLNYIAPHRHLSTKFIHYFRGDLIFRTIPLIQLSPKLLVVFPQILHRFQNNP